MPATSLPLYIEQGADFELRVQWATGDEDNPTITDLTGFTARLQVRSSASSDEALVDLDTDDGIEIDEDHWITASLNAAATAALDLPATTDQRRVNGRTWRRLGAYDLELVAPGGAVERLLEGPVYFSPEITR